MKEYSGSKLGLLGFFMLMSCAGHGGPRQLDGNYRYGHEVNTVCTGEPERCYWLVDTAPEVREQLKQRVAGLKPYTPVCLKLIAETSSEKGPGFGADYDGSIRVQQVIGPCDESVASSSVLLADLQHRRWILDRIDDMDLAAYAVSLGFEATDRPHHLPELDFGEQGRVFGNTGCNRIQGKASVEDGMLALGPLATTRMACPGFTGELELRLSIIYQQPLAVSLGEDRSLILEGGDTVLRYRLEDWVQ